MSVVFTKYSVADNKRTQLVTCNLLFLLDENAINF
jgi:hypothetical protein